MFRAICLSTALLTAVPATAAIWVDDFSGTTLNDTNFNTPSGSGNIQFQANGAQSRVELVSTGALAGSNHFQQWQHQQTIAYNSAWYFGADVFSGDAALFGAFGSGDIIDLSLNVISSLDSTDRAQFNFVVGSPFGSAIHGARFAKRTNDTDLDEVINGALGTAPVTGRISLQFDPNTSIISAFYNFGSGSTLLGTTNISDWGMTSGHFTFMIEGGASNVSPPNQIVGGISIPAASTYLDAAILATPEPSRALLAAAAFSAVMFRRRRAA